MLVRLLRIFVLKDYWQIFQHFLSLFKNSYFSDGVWLVLAYPKSPAPASMPGILLEDARLSFDYEKAFDPGTSARLKVSVSNLKSLI